MTATHPQNTVPQRVVDRVAVVIRRDLLGGDDLHDVTVAVDLGEEAPVGPGEDLHEVLVDLTDVYDVSAAFLVDEACVCLGWPVAS